MAKSLAVLGGGLGIILALGLAVVRVTNSAEPLDLESALGNVAFAVVYLAPFAVALWAVAWRNPALQAAVWLAAGVLGFLASWTAFSGVSLVFLPTAPLLIVAGVLAAIQAVRGAGAVSLAPVLPVAAGMTVLGAAAWLVMITLTSDPRCWVLVRYADGQTVWQRDPASEAAMIITHGPNGETGVFGSGEGVGGPGVNGVQRVSATCSSDVVSPVESGAALGLWVLGIGGLFWLKHIWQVKLTAQAGGSSWTS